MTQRKLNLSIHTILAAVAVAGSLVGLPRYCVARVGAPAVAAPTRATPSATSGVGTRRQQQWMQATLEQRVRLAESLGEDGARDFAKSKPWEAIFDGANKSRPQGLDQVYRASDGVVHVIEAKGGSSPLGHAYGHPQGSSEWAVESAKRTLHSPTASAKEKAAADAVLKAASQRTLRVHVVRTSHVLGEPTRVVLEQTAQTSEAASKLAGSALDDLARASAQAVDDTARVGSSASPTVPKGTGTALKTVAKATVVVGLAVDAGLRVRDGVETERRYEAGEISVQEREVAHARNGTGMAGGWAGALASAKLGAKTLGAAGSCVAPGPGTAVGVVVGGVGGGVAGYFGGEAAAEAAAEWAVKAVHAAGSTIGEAAESARSATGNAARATGDAVRRAWSRATDW